MLFRSHQQTEKTLLEQIFETYYQNDKIKAIYEERTDKTLINYFKNGLLSRYKSRSIALRKVENLTILDSIRKEVKWA